MNISLSWFRNNLFFIGGELKVQHLQEYLEIYEGRRTPTFFISYGDYMYVYVCLNYGEFYMKKQPIANIS